MKDNSDNISEVKTNLHPRNKHRSPYNFRELVSVSGELQQFLSGNKFKNESIDFSDPKAVKALNRALLRQFYEINYWDVPDGYLCPAIPGRADYIHYIADLLAESNEGIIPQGDSVFILDLGVGANCVYPIVGRKEYGWQFTGSDVDPVAINSAKKIVTSNKLLVHRVDCRLQPDPSKFFQGIILQNEKYDAVICNPPFHTSAEAASAGTERKNKNLGSKRVADGSMNFGGQINELIYKGGEASFIYFMILESVEFSKSVLWFSTLVSDKHHLAAIYKTLEKVKTTQVKTINMSQGQKKSRIVAWTFFNAKEQQEWFVQKSQESVVRSS